MSRNYDIARNIYESKHVPAEVAFRFDRVFAVYPQNGSLTRYLLAPFLECDLTIFADDDLVPGPLVVDTFLKAAQLLNGEFASIGQIGRRCMVERKSKEVKGKRVIEAKHSVFPRDVFNTGSMPVLPVDFSIRCVMFNTRLLPYLDLIRRKTGLKLPFGLSGFAGACDLTGPLREDDIFTQCSLQAAFGLQSYVIKRTIAAKALSYCNFVNAIELPAPGALCSDPQHDKNRHATLDFLHKGFGWQCLDDRT